MYEINRDQRKEIVDEILKLISDNKDITRKTIDDLVDKFEGQDMNAIGLLYRAAEASRFEEYVAKLNDYYTKDGQYVSVDNRKAARNYNITILRDIVNKETEIVNLERPASHRNYWPIEVQTLAKSLGSVKMELFFADCFQEIMKK